MVAGHMALGTRLLVDRRALVRSADRHVCVDNYFSSQSMESSKFDAGKSKPLLMRSPEVALASVQEMAVSFSES